MISSQEIEFDEYLAAKTFCSSGTCPNLAKITLFENEAADEPLNYHSRWPNEFIILEKGDLDTAVTLKDHSVDLLIPTTESPFDELDEKLTNEEKIKKLIDFVREGSKIQFGHELAVKLNFLNEVVNEDPDEDSISIDSMRNFISFLQNSVNWMEHFGETDQKAQIAKIREHIELSLAKSGLFAVLNVGRITDQIQRFGEKKLAILHEPTQGDPSHSGVHGYQHEDLLVAELIAETVVKTYPSRQM